MNKDICLLFRCLCRDLGVQLLKPLDGQVALELASLKDEMLSLVENEAFAYTNSICLIEYHKWVHKFHELFLVIDHSRVRIWDLKDPLVFGDVYQLLCFVLKLEVEITQEHEDKYIQSLKANEKDCQSWAVDRSNPVSRMARSILRRSSAGYRTHTLRDSQDNTILAVESLDGLDLSWRNIQRFGRHGPGATYMREAGSDKDWFNVCYRQLESYYPFVGFFANERVAWHFDTFSPVLREERWVKARLTLVPKTVKGPRGVYIGPKEAIFVQIGIDGAIKDWVNRSWLKAAYQPKSQSRSRDLSLRSSATRESATLDLKDASDRIPRSLIAWMFHRQDYLAMACTRPSFIELPNGETIRASMASPMGDGKTFAVLSVLCIVLTVSAMLVKDGFHPSDTVPLRVLRKYAEKIAVFGDDIIVPSEYFSYVCESLEMHNLRVNHSKSFVKGPFRESCGMDAFNGVNVTPLRIKSPTLSAESHLNWIDLHNRMVFKRPDLRRTIGTLRALIERCFPMTGITTDSARCPSCLVVDRVEIDSWFTVVGNNTEAPYCLAVASKRPGALRSRMIRWNADLMKYEQLCHVTPRAQQFLESLDPRWSLNYALLPKGSVYVDPLEVNTEPNPFGSPRRKILGSPTRTKHEQNDRVANDRKLITLLDRMQESFLPSTRKGAAARKLVLSRGHKDASGNVARRIEDTQAVLPLAWCDIV